ncbi:MAG: hypothetical protein EP343_00860 [Deltaproteobacteria bacterium]|nr:MAG: hypothetical protein EP343_00860 [Deltaproteobacteria bacterium]
MMNFDLRFAKQHSWSRWVAVFLLLGSTCCALGCDKKNYTQEERRNLHLPSGWSLGEASQMLARSYAYSNWVTIISRLQGTPQKLFATSYRTPPMPNAGGMFGVLGSRRRQPQPMAPGMPGQKQAPKKKTKQVYGFYYIIRSNRSVDLELRLPVRGRRWGVVNFYHPFHLPRTGAGWKRVNFLYKDFKPLEKESGARLNRYRVLHAEFWERTNKSHPPSVSMTIKGPYLYISKTPPPSQFASSKPTSRASSQPGSRPTRQRATTQPIQPRKP